MRKNWILSFESWPVCVDIPLIQNNEELSCSWSHGRFVINARVAIGNPAVLHIHFTKTSLTLLRAETAGRPQSDGWVFALTLESKNHSKDEFDRSKMRVTVTPDAEIRTLFANAPFGLSYMPVMRHFFEKTPPRSILEWGPGRSTLMLAESLPGTDIFSIEHNPQWHERIVTLSNTHPSLTPIHEPLTLQPGRSGKYVTVPLYLDRKFDLIFIDGRMRTDCIAIARQVLKDNGVVLVHDANRATYHQAFCFYRSTIIVNDTAILRSNA